MVNQVQQIVQVGGVAMAEARAAQTPAPRIRNPPALKQWWQEPSAVLLVHSIVAMSLLTVTLVIVVFLLSG